MKAGESDETTTSFSVSYACDGSAGGRWSGHGGGVGGATGRGVGAVSETVTRERCVGPRSAAVGNSPAVKRRQRSCRSDGPHPRARRPAHPGDRAAS